MVIAKDLLESPFSVYPVGSILFQEIINLSLTPGSEVRDFIMAWKKKTFIVYACACGSLSLSIAITNTLFESSMCVKRDPAE